MLEIHTGKVKFFRADKGWGFIVPDQGGSDVWFHVEYFSGVTEPYDGELGFEFEADATLVGSYRVPEPDDAIVYQEYKEPMKGLMAIHWLYPETLAQAEKMLKVRPESLCNFPVQVMRYGPEEEVSGHPTTVWEGTLDEFRQKLDDDLPEMLDKTCYVERLEIDGQWRRMWHPRDWHVKYMHKADTQPQPVH